MCVRVAVRSAFAPLLVSTSLGTARFVETIDDYAGGDLPKD